MDHTRHRTEYRARRSAGEESGRGKRAGAHRVERATVTRVASRRVASRIVIASSRLRIFASSIHWI